MPIIIYLFFISLKLNLISWLNSALKPQTVLSVPAEYYMARTEFMKLAASSEITNIPLSQITSVLGKFAQQHHKIATYSPVIQARAIVKLK